METKDAIATLSDQLMKLTNKVQHLCLRNPLSAPLYHLALYEYRDFLYHIRALECIPRLDKIYDNASEVPALSE
jgi:hypothetical protein